MDNPFLLWWYSLAWRTFLSSACAKMSMENVGWLSGRAENMDRFIPQRNSCPRSSKCQALCWVLGYIKKKVEMTRSPRKLSVVWEKDKKMACITLLEKWYLKAKTKKNTHTKKNKAMHRLQGQYKDLGYNIGGEWVGGEDFQEERSLKGRGRSHQADVGKRVARYPDQKETVWR